MSCPFHLASFTDNSRSGRHHPQSETAAAAVAAGPAPNKAYTPDMYVLVLVAAVRIPVHSCLVPIPTLERHLVVEAEPDSGLVLVVVGM